MDVVTIKNLTKTFKIKQKKDGFKASIISLFKPHYKTLHAVQNISFIIKNGEMVGFIGPNGAGKSTTIKMMAGILFPSSGKIKILNYDPQKERKKLSYKIGTVFGQKPQLWYHLPAIDTYNLFSKIFEIPQKEFEERLQRYIKIFEVEDIVHQPVRKLSLGERMRCEMIASLLHNPQVLFLDEPTIGMDIIVKKKIRELIRKLNKEEKITIVLTSHDMEDVEQICKRLIIINKGKIVYDGSMKDIREKYLSKKRIVVILQDKAEINVPGAKILYKGAYKLALEIDTKVTPVKDFVKTIVSKYNVADISVLDPPIEEIIEEIYKK